MNTRLHFYILLVLLMLSHPVLADGCRIYGTVTSKDKECVPFATVGVEKSALGTNADGEGIYEILLPEGEYVIYVSAMGYASRKMNVRLSENEALECNVELEPVATELDGIVVTETVSGASRLRRSAYNAVAIDTKDFLNTTKNLADILSTTPGVKLRESGGVGSEMNMMMDGFSGRNVKVFIDGVPQEGVGSSFGVNNIPVNFAERIEVYRGVVPVEFGTDAMGGVVNIVTKKQRERWNVEASYSYGSFNTHRSFLNFNRTFNNGFTFEVNAFQNYSDNNYKVNVPVEDFVTGSIEKKKLHLVERFNDTYHNEALSVKLGVIGKKWADKLLFGVRLSQMYKDIQTGVRQEIVYGAKHRTSYSVMPSAEYSKKNLFAPGLDVAATLNYNRNAVTNVDTSMYKYNWLGETKLLNSSGEQSNQHTRSDNDNWNATLTVDYRPKRSHTHLFTLHSTFNAFERGNTSLLLYGNVKDPIKKVTRKGVTGLSYRLMPKDSWNVTLFGKYYNLYVVGPVATTGNADDYVRDARSANAFGYGIAGTYFILPGLQAKLSYEKALRLPTIEEMFGDEDLEMGDMGIKPEKSHNANINLSYGRTFDAHGVYAELGLVYRDTRDYIQRNIVDLSGGKSAATYINYGKVLTVGYNVTARYNWKEWLSVGGNFTKMDVLDNMKTAMGSSVPNLGYRENMPNLPSMFADFDATFNIKRFFMKDDSFSLTYEGRFVEKFSFYSAKIGANKGDFMVPDQLSHNITLSYSIMNGRYNFSFVCNNITDERLYDNFSLQKPGRAFYGKVRVVFGK